MIYRLTWGGCPYLVAEFGRVGGANPCSGTRVQGRGAVILRPAHVGAVRAQHVWVRWWGVQAPSSRRQVQEAATAGPQPAKWAQALRLECLLKPGTLPPFPARGWGGEGRGYPGGVEWSGGMWVQWGFGEGATAPGGNGGVVGWVQGVAGGPIQQLEIAEEAGWEHLSDFGRKNNGEIGDLKGVKVKYSVRAGAGSHLSCVCMRTVLDCGFGWKRRKAGRWSPSPDWRRKPPPPLEATDPDQRRNSPEDQSWAERGTPSGTAPKSLPCWQLETHEGEPRYSQFPAFWHSFLLSHI